jgi:hypothetical protein
MSLTRAQRRIRARDRQQQQQQQQAPEVLRSPRKLVTGAPPRYWHPMERAPRAVDSQMDELIERYPAVARVMGPAPEVWLGGWSDGNEYVTSAARDQAGHVLVLAIRRVDRKAVHDWRDKQRIKNEIAGPEVEAFEQYPGRARTFDVANVDFMWCLPPGQQIPAGFDERIVTGQNHPHYPMTRQRPFTDKEQGDAI